MTGTEPGAERFLYEIENQSGFNMINIKLVSVTGNTCETASMCLLTLSNYENCVKAVFSIDHTNFGHQLLAGLETYENC